MEDSWHAVLQQMEAPTPAMRTDAIDQVTVMLQQREWELTSRETQELVGALRERLGDSNWYANGKPIETVKPRPTPACARRHRSVAQKCLLLIGDLVAEPHEEVPCHIARTPLLHSSRPLVGRRPMCSWVLS